MTRLGRRALTGARRLLGQALLLGLAWSALADGTRPRLVAVAASGPIEIDARLDEPDWERAALIDELRTPEPVRGAPLPQRTEIRVLYDAGTLYLGLRAFDTEPDAISASIMRRDFTQRTEDRFTISIDTFHERRTGYLFQVNPNGARFDALIEDGGGLSEEWDGIWYARARIDTRGWVAEVAIPVKSLNFDPRRTTWGLNVSRTISRVNLEGRWASPDPSHPDHDVSHFGDLEGLVGLEQGIGLDVVASLAGRHVRERDEDRSFSKGDPSVDVFYKITPSLTSTLTTNTDFSDAPPDERRANLTRFSLFFPEQRDFFLQDSGIFRFAEFGSQATFRRQRVNGQPFFSRRIALAPDGPLDIRFGGKLTGRVGRVNLGVLTTRVESHDDVDGKWLSVGRATVNVLEESTLGVIATYGDPDSDAHSKLFGADFNYQSSRFLGDRILEGNLWAQRSSSSGPGDREAAFGARLTYPNDRWFWDVSAVEIQENFDPALGFANRTDIREYAGQLRRRWRPGGGIRTLNAQVRPLIVTGTDGDLQSVTIEVDPFLIDTEISDTFWLRGIYRREDLLDDFEIRPGIVIPRDSYVFERVQLYFDSSRNRPFEAAVRVEWGGFFDGTRLDTSLALDWRPGRHLVLGADWERFQVRLPQGRFTTHIARLTADVAFSPWLTWTNLIQWDNETEDLTWSLRVRWIVEPGRELVLVLDPSLRRDDRLSFDSTRTEAVLKLVWTQRY